MVKMVTLRLKLSSVCSPIISHYPPMSEASGEFIEIRHKQISPTHILSTIGSTLANFQLFSGHLVCIDGPIGH